MGGFSGTGEGRIGSDFPDVGFLPEIRSWRWLCSTGNITRFKMVNFVLCDYYLTTNCRKSRHMGRGVQWVCNQKTRKKRFYRVVSYQKYSSLAFIMFDICQLVQIYDFSFKIEYLLSYLILYSYSKMGPPNCMNSRLHKTWMTLGCILASNKSDSSTVLSF